MEEVPISVGICGFQSKEVRGAENSLSCMMLGVRFSG